MKKLLDFFRLNLQRLTFVPLAILGVVIVGFAGSQKLEPEKVDLNETSTSVRTVVAREYDVIPRASGFGVVEPGQVWTAVAQVDGRVVYLPENFRNGQRVKKGTLIVRIDPTDYELLVAERQARVSNVHAQLETLNAESQSATKLLEIEKTTLELTSRNYDRYTELGNSGAVSDSEIENRERELLHSKRTVQDLKNQIQILTAKEKELQSQLDLERTQLQLAKANLNRTKFIAPFDGVISDLRIEENQYVGAGGILFQIDSTEYSEIPAQISQKGIARLGNFNASGHPQLSGIVVRTSSLSEKKWDATFSRFTDGYDEQTGTLGAVVRVTAPWTDPEHPLKKGLFTEVLLYGKPIPNSLVIPRSSVTEGVVYILNANSRLERRPVKVGFFQDDFAVISHGLNPGDQVIISDITPPIEGMLLRANNAPEVTTRIAYQATGSSSGKIIE